MKTLLPLLALGLAAPLTYGDITATFVDVDSFTDFTLRGQNEVRTQAVFERELQRDRRLSSFVGDRTLELTFTDIDMAGDIQPWRNHSNSDIRYIEAVYPPRIVFSYVLKDAEGNELASGEESLRDLAFQQTIDPIGQSDPFVYELRLLEDWARRTIRVP